MHPHRAAPRRTALLLLGGLALAVPALRAQETKPAKPVALTFDLGLVNAAGNTSVTTVNGAENLKLQPVHSPWQFAQAVSVVYGRNQDSVTAEQLTAMGRVDYTVVTRLHVFAGGTYQRDRFAGIGRRFEEIGGLGLQLVNQPRDVLSAELGVAVTQQRSTTAVEDNFVALRLAAKYKHNLSDNAFVQQSVEWLPNVQEFKDTRINSETALVAPITKQIALRLSYVVRFDNVPEPGFLKTDRVLSSGAQIAL
jgi:putative salt-induced outer membrane protein